MSSQQLSAEDFENFLYHITHDLKANIRAIRMLPDWIVEDLAEGDVVLPEAVTDHLIMLRNYATDMDNMLDGLTNLSRIGRMADQPCSHNLDDIVLRAWATTPDHRRYKLHYDLGEQLDVFGPGNELERLFSVLFSNAIIHHDKEVGNIWVKVSVDHDRLVLCVADDGPGIPQQFRDTVFEPLKTLQSRESTGAAGVGLAIARRIIENLDGTIEIVDGDHTLGCIHTFDLPMSTNVRATGT